MKFPFPHWRRVVFALAIAGVPLAANPATSPAPAAATPGDGLFTEGMTPRITIEVGTDALQSLRRDPREFVRATVREGGKLFNQVGVHLKGSVGSFRPVDDRPAFTLDFCQFNEGRKFYGLRRIHLNNSVEDPACVNEKLGSELFQAAGVPAPRVTRALVTLNGRALGLYVLKEGFTEDFLSCHFKTVGGDLYEPEAGHDVDQRFKRNSVAGPSLGRAPLQALAAAASEPDLERRWRRLQATLDTDRFLSFMAMEVMLGHRDGYCLARNNFRVYHDVDSGKMVFFPHGMDQLLGTADLPWQPHFGGLVAQAVMETTEGKRLYAARFNSLFTNLFQADALTRRVDQLVLEVRPLLGGTNWTTLRDESDRVKQRLRDRYASLKAQCQEAPLKPLEFVAGICHLSGWRVAEALPGGRMEEAKSTDGLRALRIVAGGETAAAWKTRAVLTQGHYRFEGRCRVAGVKPLPYGVHQGAGLRLGGHVRQTGNLTGDSTWKLLAADFQVEHDGEEVEFICELRAASGEAWFEVGSLGVVRKP